MQKVIVSSKKHKIMLDVNDNVIKIRKRISKSNRTYLMIIPKPFIDSGILRLDREYMIYIDTKDFKEINESEKKKSSKISK